MVRLWLLCLVALPAAAQTLQYDQLPAGGSGTFPNGFVTGEAVAVRFTPPDAGQWRVDAVEMLFGGGTGGDRTVTLRVYDDRAAMDAPGTSIYSGDFVVSNSSTNLQELAPEDVVVDGTFRVAIEYQHDGLPSVARDNGNDGGRSWIYTLPPAWSLSQDLGIAGDWVLRARVSFIPPDSGVVDAGSVDSGVVDAGVPDAGVVDSGVVDAGAPDAGTMTPDAGAPDSGVVTDAGTNTLPGYGDACVVSSECKTGLHCAMSKCTYECRVDSDCGTSMTCTTSNGTCGEKPEEPKGCGCTSAAGPLLFGLALLLRARRRISPNL